MIVWSCSKQFHRTHCQPNCANAGCKCENVADCFFVFFFTSARVWSEHPASAGGWPGNLVLPCLKGKSCTCQDSNHACKPSSHSATLPLHRALAKLDTKHKPLPLLQLLVKPTATLWCCWHSPYSNMVVGAQANSTFLTNPVVPTFCHALEEPAGDCLPPDPWAKPTTKSSHCKT